jgi:two-component system OmpR family sensor kinase
MGQHVSAPFATPASGGRRRVLFEFDEGFFARGPAIVVVLVCALLVAGTVAADVATGPHLSLSLFYLIPPALLAWRFGRVGGALSAGVTAVIWTAADLASGAYEGDGLAPVWNVTIRFFLMVGVSALLAQLHDTMRLQRRMTDDAVDAADQLRSLNALKDTLLHAVSHDLRGPIAAILGSADLLDRRSGMGLSEAEVDELIAGTRVSGRKLNRLVEDLLDLERLDRGVVEPERTATDLGALAARVIAEATYADRHPIRLEPGEVVRIEVDEGKVDRIVENLLSNAVKHTPPGTAIHVRVERSPGGALLSVEDEGPGVPDDVKVSIFDAFRQGSGVRSGSGIGLSLVAKFAELHGGRAWVEDRPGGGAAFRVFLPGEAAGSPATRGMSEAASAGR